MKWITNKRVPGVIKVLFPFPILTTNWNQGLEESQILIEDRNGMRRANMPAGLQIPELAWGLWHELLEGKRKQKTEVYITQDSPFTIISSTCFVGISGVRTVSCFQLAGG